jgi:hypothetical protein
MNRSTLFSALAAACLLTTGAMAQTPKPMKPLTPKPTVVATTTTDTTKKKPVMTHKKKGHKPVKPDSTKTKKPN